MPRSKPAWSIDEKTDRYKAKVQVWEDGVAEYTLSRRAPKGVMDLVFGRKTPWVTERKQFNLRGLTEDLPPEVWRLLRRLNLPKDLWSGRGPV